MGEGRTGKRVGATLVLAFAVVAGCGGDDAQDTDLDRQLIAAAHANDIAAARALIAEGADVNAKDDTVQSAFLIATSEVGDDPRLLELTLKHGARVNDRDSYDGTGLIRAAERGHPRIVRRLLNAGIERDHVNRLGWTALHEAIVLGDGGPAHVQTVEALVDGGVDINLPDGNGVRPLRLAEEHGHERIAAVLRAAGARRATARSTTADGSDLLTPG
jgi:uncharacterized protein